MAEGITLIFVVAEIYDSEEMAAGYAHDRPRIHGRIIEGLGLPRVRAALDVGCGAGVSAAAIGDLAEFVVGIEIQPTMLRYRLPGARYVIGDAQRLPFRDAAFGLITAAGSLNYVDGLVALPELERVLAPGGRLVIYDCATGWPEGVEPRWGVDPDYFMDPRELPFEAAGLRLMSYVEREIRVEMTLDGYARYMRTEGGEEAERWARTALDGSTLGVIFDTYAACAMRDG